MQTASLTVSGGKKSKSGISKKEHQHAQQLHQRVNLSQIKKLIDRHLDDRKSLYWNTFIKYLQAKLSKTEWDHFVKITFGYEFIALHNYFIKSLLFNARVSTFHQLHSIGGNNQNNRTRTTGLNSMMMLMKKESLNNLFPVSIHRSIVAPPFDASRKINLLSHSISSSTSSQYSSQSASHYEKQHFSLSRDFIERKMNKIANDMGLLNGVDGDSVNLLLISAESYLKYFISKCLQYKSSQRCQNTRGEHNPMTTTMMDEEESDEQAEENGVKNAATTSVSRSFIKPEPGSYLVQDGNYIHSYRHYTDELTYLTNANNEEEPREDIDKFVITPKDLVMTIQACPNLTDNMTIKEKILDMEWDMYN
ncbi:hypothetical protein C9374_014133 [Naegleria lovaniensis]|uniref:Transcriptional regulator of RNA polII, SAGA, subunit-domain-containing protein n=1 Tax=Naegleria lovaniensis TaxID=51637 RepID=A0AA88KPL9_NAELO|nr:uncharacterized protein C9374_014133 [Naegleria lovaniensis]KAG2389573.1 hypothetical protein C9374_014133 [Naegleria lovaniensis]